MAQQVLKPFAENLPAPSSLSIRKVKKKISKFSPYMGGGKKRGELKGRTNRFSKSKKEKITEFCIFKCPFY